MPITTEQLLDKIADEIILNIDSNTLSDVIIRNQKTIRNGTIQLDREPNNKLVLYQKDVEANKKDLAYTESDEFSKLEAIANSINYVEKIEVTIEPAGDESIYDFEINITAEDGAVLENISFIAQTSDNNPLNISQFMSVENTETAVNPEDANRFLDTNIFELLPTGDTRQARIIRFFQELNALLPPTEPEFDLNDDGRVDRGEDETWISASIYSQDNSISYAQDNEDGNIDEEDAFIHRLKDTANDTNQDRTIEDIYKTIEPYLTDILEDPFELEDGRPEYENQSSGYLKFRNLNQGIIIRNTNKKYLQGLNPDNPTWLTSNYPGLLTQVSDDLLAADFISNNSPGTGFTITMWVKFLDKVSSGTLFNFGNPTREENPFGFKLETYVVNKDDPTIESNSGGTDYTNFGEFVDANAYLSNTLGLFKNTNTERFVRLQVREFGNASPVDTDRGLRDSHIGNPTIRKFSWNPGELNPSNPGFDDLRLLSTTNVPEDFNEWYFICASYNPRVIEPIEAANNYDGIYDDFYELYDRDSDFWLNHKNPFSNESVVFSGFGNKCKVEIISRTDLLRARGYKV